MKRITKKEMEAMEELKKAQRRLRREMVESLQSYWKDVAAMERVAKLSNNNDILVGGNLIKEEKDKLYSNYSILEGLTINQISALRTLIQNEKERDEIYRGIKNPYMKEELPDDAIWVRDIVWREEDLLEQIELFKRIGINKVYYTDRSTAALDAVIWFTRLGAKIIGTTNISEYNEGLIIEL